MGSSVLATAFLTIFGGVLTVLALPYIMFFLYPLMYFLFGSEDDEKEFGSRKRPVLRSDPQGP